MATRTEPRDIPFAKNISKVVDSLNELSLPTDTAAPFLSSRFPPKLSKKQQIKCPNSTFESSTPGKQRSVSFILHEESEDDRFEVDDQDDSFDDSYGISTSPVQEKFYIDALEEYTINISGCDLSSDIFVSLMDRDMEMRDLFICNQDFFDLVKQCIFGTSEEGWQEFLEILYSPRHILLDTEWMSIISETLSPNPPLLAKFKEIVGYCEVDDDDNDDDNDDDDDDNESTSNMEEYDCDDDYYYYYDDDDDFNFSYSSSVSSRNSYTIGDANLGENFLDVSVIRDYPKILENLETSYPQFFLNVNQFLSRQAEYRGSVLGGNHLSQTRRSGRGGNTIDSELSSSWRRYLPATSSPLKPTNLSSKTSTLYDEFKSVLLSSRSEMSDQEWEIAIYEYLDPWPQLAAQFEEIISYEIGED